MTQQLNDSILPNFPETEAFSSIRFYLKYSHWDLLKRIKILDELQNLDFKQPYSFKELREEFPSVLYGGLDFIIYFRIAQSLIALGQTISKSTLVEMGEDLILQGDIRNESSKHPPPDDTLDHPDNVIKKLHSLTVRIHEVVSKIEEIAEYKGGNSNAFDLLEKGLKDLAMKFTQEIIPCADDIYMQAWGLYRREYPEEAREEDFWQMIYTPLYEEYHPHALALEKCPRCGAILTREDVYGRAPSSMIPDSETGKYCESCRSRWIQSLAD
jgi:hypothetical protein